MMEMEGSPLFPLPRTMANNTFIALILAMLFSLLPSPLQQFLRRLFFRGKLVPLSPTPLLNLTVPQSFFTHFYILGTFFNGLLLSMMLCYIFCMPTFMGEFKMGRQEAWRSLVFLFLLELQILRRLYENVFVTKFSPFARMHVLAYLLGILYYVLAPLSLFPRAEEMLVKTLRGLKSYRHEELHIENEAWKSLLEIGWLYWLGGLIFIWGWFHQFRCHMILASLRSKSKEDRNVYKIPYGDWFEYVSSAHYFAEFVMYFSFIVATGGRNIDTWLLFAFVVLNLWIVAIDTHKWYKAKFEDYPVSRKAIIPFVY